MIEFLEGLLFTHLKFNAFPVDVSPGLYLIRMLRQSMEI
jgi:hypothetical protein